MHNVKCDVIYLYSLDTIMKAQQPPGLTLYSL